MINNPVSTHSVRGSLSDSSPYFFCHFKIPSKAAKTLRGKMMKNKEKIKEEMKRENTVGSW